MGLLKYVAITIVACCGFESLSVGADTPPCSVTVSARQAKGYVSASAAMKDWINEANLTAGNSRN